MNRKDLQKELTLFKEKGSVNTRACFEAVADRMSDLGLQYLIVASTSGETGAKAVNFFKKHDVKIVVVSHQYGFKKDGEIEFQDRYRKRIENSDNASLVITPDLLTRVPKITRGKYGGYNPLDLVADTLRIFSQGMKVCIECTIQAADAGKIPVNEEIVAVAGTSSGADTGIVLQGQHSHKLFQMDVKEIICMPRDK